MHADGPYLNTLSGQVIGCAFTVLNTLGARFLKKVFENALALELRDAGFLVAQQYPVSVTYKGSVIGQYSVDLLVEEVLMIELKTARALDEVHRLQCVNYLKATGLNLCLLLNFGKPKLEFRRVIHGR